MRTVFLLMALALFIFLLGCSQAPPKPTPEQLCVQTCQAALANNTDMTNGPCLGDPMPQMPSWACDVAHDPRQPLDDLPQNQCASYRAGQVLHFVEVSPECKLLRSR